MIFCAFFTCRSLTSPPSTAQPVQLGVGDAGQDQSKSGPAVLASGGATNTPSQPAWNPFDDDNFSNLTAEEFKTEDKKPTGKVCVRMCVCVVHLTNCLITEFLSFRRTVRN